MESFSRRECCKFEDVSSGPRQCRARSEKRHKARLHKQAGKELQVDVVTYHPKEFSVWNLLRGFSAEDGLTAGRNTEKVRCSMSASPLCLDDPLVLPSGAMRMKGCDEAHYVCNSCAVAALRNATVSTPKCPVYRCAGTFDEFAARRITGGNTELYRKVIDLFHDSSLRKFARSQEWTMFACPRCLRKVRPNSFIKNFSVTLCPSCEQCWCRICGKDENAPLGRVCLLELGLRLANDQSKGEQLANEYGYDRLKKAAEEYNRQLAVLVTMYPCPECEAPITKSEGCNKMTCTQCATPFCFQCGGAVDPRNPYNHFKNSRCNVYDGPYD